MKYYFLKNYKFLLLFLSFVFYLFSCENSQKPDMKTSSEIIQYLALGDSYTIGESVAENERWPVQLADSLRERGYKIDEPLIIAKTGWTTDELQEGIKQINPHGPFKLVTLLIGVNNQYRGRNIEEYRIQFNQLLEQAITFAGGHKYKVVVLSIPDWGVTPFASGRDRNKIAVEIDQFNVINKEETEKKGISYVDVTPFSREATTDTTLVASDGLHPSGKMYSGWVRLALPKIVKMLESNSEH
jgi:lysophospholipase L1-like esterase